MTETLITMDFRTAARGYIREIYEALDSDSACSDCRNKAAGCMTDSVRLLTLRGPHVGSNFGVSVPRLVLVGLENPDVGHCGDPCAQMDKDTEGLERPQLKGASLHRQGEWAAAAWFLREWDPSLFAGKNPFHYIAAVNGHLCGLAKNGRSTASASLPGCSHAWAIVRNLKPHVVVVEGLDQLQHVKKHLGTWTDIPPVPRIAPIIGRSTKKRNCKAYLGHVVDQGSTTWVIVANHPSYRGSPWRNTGEGSYFAMLLQPLLLECIRELRKEGSLT
jgi:hypothetical protein